MVERKKIGPVFITKYALTKGILRLESVELIDDGQRPWVKWGTWGSAHGDDWHRTEEAAQLRVAKMVDAKLASLDKQRLKLVKLREKGVRIVGEEK